MVPFANPKTHFGEYPTPFMRENCQKSVKSEKIGFENRPKSKLFLAKLFLRSTGTFSESLIKIAQCISKSVKMIQIHRI